MKIQKMNYLICKKLLILIICIFIFTTNISSIEAYYNGNKTNVISKTLYVGGTGPGNYTNIKDAIDNATAGDNIFVYAGVYNESIIVDKSLSLHGENRDVTIIDAGGFSDGVKIIADSVEFCNFTVCNTGIGYTSDVLYNSAIEIIRSSGNRIENNLCIDTNYGVWGEYSNDNIIQNNTIYGYWDGISLDESKNNKLRNNSMYGSSVLVDGSSIPNISHDIDSSNSVNNKPVYYFKNENNINVPKDAGQVILANCSNCVVADLVIYNVTDGIEVLFSNNNIIRNNTIYDTKDFSIHVRKSNYNQIIYNNCSDGYNGIGLMTGGFDAPKKNADCKYNHIAYNNLVNNKIMGLRIASSDYNEIYNNNFVGNYYGNAEFISSKGNKWYNNYWDDWIGLKYSFLSFMPKVILGAPCKNLLWLKIWPNFDWKPALEPFDQ